MRRMGSTADPCDAENLPMYTGNIITRCKDNPHLTQGVDYIEVFPAGTIADLRIIRSIPRALRTYSAIPKLAGQSAILVDTATWDDVRRKNNLE